MPCYLCDSNFILKNTVSADYPFKFNLKNLRKTVLKNYMSVEPIKDLFIIYLSSLLDLIQ